MGGSNFLKIINICKDIKHFFPEKVTLFCSDSQIFLNKFISQKLIEKLISKFKNRVFKQIDFSSRLDRGRSS